MYRVVSKKMVFRPDLCSSITTQTERAAAGETILIRGYATHTVVNLITHGSLQHPQSKRESPHWEEKGKIFKNMDRISLLSHQYARESTAYDKTKNANTTTGSVSFFHYSRSFNVSLGGCNTQECIKYGDDKSLFIFTLLLSSNLENTILQVYEAVVLVRVRSYGKIAARCKTCWPWCFFSVCQSPGYHSHENS